APQLTKEHIGMTTGSEIFRSTHDESARIMNRFSPVTVAVFLVTVSLAVAFGAEEWLSGIKWLEPPRVTPGADNGPPSDAIALFDGKDLSQWNGGENWIVKDGYAVANANEITSKQGFGDCQLHLEVTATEMIGGDGKA